MKTPDVENRNIGLPQVVSRDEWLVARKAFLAKEKAFTRERDVLNAERRQLPMVKIDKAYVFEGPAGRVSLLDAVFHTYSNYARGAEMTGGSYYYLDLTALGRQEVWEEPKGRATTVRPAIPDFST